jgi:hypothetical protein
MGLLNSFTGAVVEGYMNPSGSEAYRPLPVYADAVASVLAFMISIILVSLVGLWLWNYSVVPLFEFARPAKSVFQILGLMVFIALVHG